LKALRERGDRTKNPKLQLRGKIPWGKGTSRKKVGAEQKRRHLREIPEAGGSAEASKGRRGSPPPTLQSAKSRRTRGAKDMTTELRERKLDAEEERQNDIHYLIEICKRDGIP